MINITSLSLTSKSFRNYIKFHSSFAKLNQDGISCCLCYQYMFQFVLYPHWSLREIKALVSIYIYIDRSTLYFSFLLSAVTAKIESFVEGQVFFLLNAPCLLYAGHL